MLDSSYLSRPMTRWAPVMGLMLFLVTPMSLSAQALNKWTLEDSIQRVLEVAPETRAAEAAVLARQGALQQAGVWPNPQIELRSDNKIGKDEGFGGADFTQFAISQPLPLSGRLGHQRAVARAQLAGARSNRRYQQVLLETRVAQRYHALQLATESLGLAEQRLQLANEIQNAGRRREQAGELSLLERLRLDLIRESAQQLLDKKEGEYNEAVSLFRAYLGLNKDSLPQLVPLKPFGPVPALPQLLADLSEHPALLAASQEIDSARASVKLVRAERLPDPALRWFRERDFLNGRRQEYSGIGLVVTVPLWDRKSGRLSEARARQVQAESKLQVLQRDLASRVQQSHLHLNHLVEQAGHFQLRVFEPARKVFDLTRIAYASGELEILSLIDANNTYFNAYQRYLELLQEAWQEAAELRLAAGQAFATTEQDHPS